MKKLDIYMQVFELQKDISSPQFAKTIQKGNLFTYRQIKRMFPFVNRTDKHFEDWFNNVSDQYRSFRSMIYPRSVDDTG